MARFLRSGEEDVTAKGKREETTETGFGTASPVRALVMLSIIAKGEKVFNGNVRHAWVGRRRPLRR
jgi:hypothetical protein